MDFWKHFFNQRQKKTVTPGQIEEIKSEGESPSTDSSKEGTPVTQSFQDKTGNHDQKNGIQRST
jgi:hypothetical protein